MAKLLWIILIIANISYAKHCEVDSVYFENFENDDVKKLKPLVFGDCNNWILAKNQLEKDYENRGFLAVKIQGELLAHFDSTFILNLHFERGAAYVWANPVNLDSGGTKPEVFEKLSGLRAGELVSPLNLYRAEKKLSRLGYFEPTQKTQMYRDKIRNIIVPAFYMKRSTNSEAYALLTYSSDNNLWEGNVNLYLYNILGTARDLKIEGFTGESGRRLEGFYKEPWLFNSSWNLIFRGYFDEDSLNREAYGEIGFLREIGFDFTIAVFVGLGDSKKTSSLEISYESLDRFILPRTGRKFTANATWNMDRPDSLDNYLKAQAMFTYYIPLFNNFISRYEAGLGGIFATNATLNYLDNFALGGLENFRGMQPRALRSRAYGFSEMAILYQMGYDLSIETFFTPGLYRGRKPRRGWIREFDYGFAFTQYHNNWSVHFYYALRNGENYLDGIIGMGLKTLF